MRPIREARAAGAPAAPLQLPRDWPTRLAQAEACLRRGEAEQALEALDGGGDTLPAEPAAKSRLFRLRALARWRRDDALTAEEEARRALAIDPESLDAHYILCRVAARLREYAEAEAAAERYIEAFRRAFQADGRGDEYTGDYRCLSQVLEIQGQAALARGDRAAATTAFERAIKADPGHQAPYLSLAEAYRRDGRRDEACAAVERGLRACARTDELRMLAETLVARPTVSACLIVRNEEELLPGCLASIRDWVDEIIVVDTGSTDRTAAIAQEYGAKVFHQAWEGDFAKHRNYSLAQATGDWILVIDADERFSEADVPAIRRYLDDPRARAIAVNILNAAGAHGELTTFLPSVRLFRRELGLRYEGIVHNQLLLDPAEPVVRAAATIEHLGYALAPEKMRAKAERTLTLLERQLREDPDNAFALFNTAQVLLGLGAPADEATAQRIMDAARRATELTDPSAPGERHIHLMATYQRALACYLTGAYDEARQQALRALALKDDYLDPMLLLGHVHLRTGEPEQAEESYRAYLEAQAAYDPSAERDEIIVVHLRSRHAAWYGLGMAAEARADYERARECYEQAAADGGDFLDVHLRMGHLHLAAGRLAEAGQCFARQLAAEPQMAAALVGQALVLRESGRERAGELLMARALEVAGTKGADLAAQAALLLRYDAREQAARFAVAAAATGSLDRAGRRAAAEICFKAGQYQPAAELYEALAAEGEPDSDLYNDLAGCFYKTGDLEQAEHWYGRALELAPESAAVLRNLGLTRVRQGRPAEAIAALERSAETDPTQAEVVHLIADLHARQGAYRQAISLYERCLQRNPGDRLALFSLSECYFQLGCRDAAMLGYRRVLELDRDFEPAQRRLQELLETVRPG
ncbi:MAG TPA: tetratricopeptide repeat protein [candidate division Zixibacteria bacterium]|nr:tetratricopeptide repeat protein [candidate division Zixibacteria bacterium]MDD4917162.1 tetratricopeptide repeat protein [candidate division Zixibacteria bacterium]MDM7971628.1 tetratricopeptide repeat protein [candidate division Zixibacteria bacterium]HPI31827.1 tetratricopeptide repeat protein [candidate division Zixibacteria bacterium]HPM36131.1 tetratricopeptide repeat protein [candidate division Zixibacteria bacterium]